MPPPTTCPCGGPSLATCCGPYLAGEAVPPTAEHLMRSRYCAYTLRNEAYLRASWHPSTLPNEPIVEENESIQWLGLEVKSALRLRQRKADLPENQDADTPAYPFAQRDPMFLFLFSQFSTPDHQRSKFSKFANIISLVSINTHKIALNR